MSWLRATWPRVAPTSRSRTISRRRSARVATTDPASTIIPIRIAKAVAIRPWIALDSLATFSGGTAVGFPLYQQAGSWLATNVRPEWIGLGFLGLAVLLYFWMRPKRRDVFWDVDLKE